MATVAAGCGGSGPATGARIERFTAAMRGSGAGESIDPGTATLFIDEARMKTLYDGLFEIDSTMAPIPRLAQSAEPNEDGTVWTITLREATWHDGDPLTSADVLFTLSRVLGPPGKKAFIAAASLRSIDLSASRAVDERTVELVLTEPTMELPTLLSAYGTKIVKDATTDFEHPVGTGPFVFESFTPGKEFVVTANPDYWDGTPAIERLVILSTEADARLSALQSGQADFADDLTPTAVQMLDGNGEVTVDSVGNSAIAYFAMKTDRPPFDNPEVRRAVMRMVDRDELVKVALQGQAEPGNDVFGKGYEYYADFPQHTFDPGEVDALLQAAGVSNLTFDLFAAPVVDGYVEAANLFVEQAAKCGVTVNLEIGSEDTYYTEALEKGAMTMGQSGPLPVPTHFSSRLVTGAPQNRTKFSDPQFDALFAQAAATADKSAREDIYAQMHQIQYDRGGFVFWADGYWNSASRAGFTNIPAGVPNSHEWVRFDKVTRA